ncbi:MAG TPA: DUF167 domain-containing protein [Candidatus Polarisedimenticolaceae bacterium]
MTDSLDLVPVPGGTRLRLRVHPKARKDAITGVHAGALKVSVTAPPEKGKANDAVVKLLAKALDLPKGSIEIVGGETSQDKTVVVGLDPEAVRRRLTT